MSTSNKLYAALHPKTGEPFMFTFDYLRAWNEIYRITATMCHPDDIFDYTLADVEEYKTWDDMKGAMGEFLNPDEIEILYDKREVRI